MFLIEKRHPLETDIIVDILKSEGISYKLKAMRYYDTPWSEPKILGYDIEVHSDLEHFDYAKILIQKRISDIGSLEIAFKKPSVDKMGNPIIDTPKSSNTEKHKPKKSLLKHIVDWIIKK